ncbi:hypothetical protein DFH09DRAFT_1073231 [Mycena vulgaris]|nr:hypothetical protein DFH09DRAFT_1073231 [Mycena vulgaris]
MTKFCQKIPRKVGFVSTVTCNAWVVSRFNLTVSVTFQNRFTHTFLIPAKELPVSHKAFDGHSYWKDGARVEGLNKSDKPGNERDAEGKPVQRTECLRQRKHATWSVPPSVAPLVGDYSMEKLRPANLYLGFRRTCKINIHENFDVGKGQS